MANEFDRQLALEQAAEDRTMGDEYRHDYMLAEHESFVNMDARSATSDPRSIDGSHRLGTNT
jgi:hypothetical protein